MPTGLIVDIAPQSVKTLEAKLRSACPRRRNLWPPSSGLDLVVCEFVLVENNNDTNINKYDDDDKKKKNT